MPIHKLICPTPGIRFVFRDEFRPLYFISGLQSNAADVLNAQLISPETTRHYESLYNNFAKMIEIYFKNDIFWETDVFALFFQKYVHLCQRTILGLQIASIPPARAKRAL